MVEFKRKRGESFESFIRRFNKNLLYSKKLIQVREKQYLKPKKNKNKQKEYALVSRKLRAKKEYLRKTGKLKDEIKTKW